MSAATHGVRSGAPLGAASGRIVAVLEALAAAESSLAVRDLVRLTGLDRSAVNRVLAQLRRLGMTEQVPEARPRYRIGPRLLALSAAVAARDSLAGAALPILGRLVDEVGETAYLATLEASGFAFRQKVDCEKPIRYFLEMHRVLPLNAGAGGRAVLSGLPPDDAAERVHRAPLAGGTDRTVTDPVELLRRAEQDRALGYSVSFGERVVGGSAIAAPWLGPDGYCRGALLLTVPAERLDRRRVPELGAVVARAARDLSARLGHRPSWLGQAETAISG